MARMFPRTGDRRSQFIYNYGVEGEKLIEWGM